MSEEVKRITLPIVLFCVVFGLLSIGILTYIRFFLQESWDIVLAFVSGMSSVFFVMALDEIVERRKKIKEIRLRD